MLLSRLRAWQAATGGAQVVPKALCEPGWAVTADSVGARSPPISMHDCRGTPLLKAPQRGVLRCLSRQSLSASEQGHVVQLENMIRRAADTNAQRTLVACRAVCTTDQSTHALTSCASVCACSTAFTGVNFAFHTIANAHGGGRRLKGLLKGCAEQNTLGTVAAHGLSYASVSQLFLLSSEAILARPNDTRATTTDTHLQGALYPCHECWDHLVAVAAMRQENALTPLEFFTCLPPGDDAKLRVVHHFDKVMCGDSPPPITVTLLTL